MGSKVRHPRLSVRLLLGLGSGGAVVFLVLFMALLSHPPAWTLDVGASGDEHFLGRFFPAEENEATTFRWSSADSQLLLHGTGATALTLDMRLHQGHPDVGERQILTLQRPGEEPDQEAQTLARFALLPSAGWRTYRVLVPPTTTGDHLLQAVPLQLVTDTYRPGEVDGRELGFPLDQVQLTPLPPGGVAWWAVLGRALWLTLGVGVVIGWLSWLRQLVAPGLAAGWVGGVGLLLGLGLAGWLWYNPYTLGWILPTAPWVVGLAGLLLLALRLRAVQPGPRARWLLPLGAGLLFAAQLLFYTRWSVAFGLLLAVGGLLLLVLPSDDEEPTWPCADLLPAGSGPLLLVFGLALGLRLYQLAELPYGLWRDEARHGLVALRILHDPTYRPIYEPAGGVDLPGLGFYPFALALQLWGPHVWTLRLVTALAGALTIFPLYGLVSRLFGRRDVALLAAALLAVSSWHLTLSRFSFPTIFDPLLTLTGLWLLLVGLTPPASELPSWLERLRWVALLGAGGCLGAAAQTYHTGRFSPLLAGGLVLLVLVRNRQAWRAWLAGVLILSVGFGLTIAPFVGYALRYPETFNDRVGDVALLSGKNLAGAAPLAVFDDAVGRHTLMFHVEGDGNSRHHAPERPLLDFVTGLGLLFGLAWLVQNWRDWRSLLLVVVLAITVASSLFAVNGPHAMRSIGAVAWVCTIAALGWVWLVGSLVPKYVHTSRRGAYIRRGALIGAVVVALLFNSWTYFVYMPTEPRVWTSFYPIHTQIGSYLRDTADARGLAALETIYIGENLTDNDVLIYLTNGLPVQSFDGTELSRPLPPDTPGALFVLSGYTYEQDVAMLQPYLGVDPQPVQLGPHLPGTTNPAFLVYRAYAHEEQSRDDNQ